MAVTPADGQAAESTAGLVILDEDGAVGYALVMFEEPEISGIELLRRSGADPVTVSFGGLGEGVCGMGRTGCAVDVCRRRLCQTGAQDSPYWQSFTSPDGATWAPLQLGASGDRVENGELRLWAWTAATPTLAVPDVNYISTKVDQIRNQVLWEGGEPSDDRASGASPLWLGLGVVVAAAGIAATVSRRARSRSE